MSARFQELQEKAIEVLLNKVYARAYDELKNNNFSFVEPYKYFGIGCEHYTYVHDLLIKEGFDVHHNTDCKCDKDEDNCQCPLNGLYVSLLPRYTKNIKTIEAKSNVKSNEEKSPEKESIKAQVDALPSPSDCNCQTTNYDVDCPWCDRASWH